MSETMTRIAAQLAYEQATGPVIVPPPATSHRRSWWRQGGLPVDQPFKSLGDKWCVHCQDLTDHDEDAGYAVGVYVSRQRCNRCGRPSGFAIMKATLLEPGAFPTVAVIWCNARGADRS
jgi:hypothetical protein